MKTKYIFIHLLTTFCLAVPAFAGDACSHVTLDWIREHLPGAGKPNAPLADARIISKQPRMDFCEAVLAVDGKLAPVYAGRASIVAGKMYSRGMAVTRDTMAGLSDAAARERKRFQEKIKRQEAERSSFLKENRKVMESMVSMTFQPSRPKDFIYVVTDPRCPHCEALLPELETLAFEKKLGLKFILNPVLGGESRDLVTRALCDEVTYADFRAMDTSGDAPACDKAEGLIRKTADFMAAAHLTAVPAVIASDGSWVVEGNNMALLKSRLGLTRAPETHTN